MAMTIVQAGHPVLRTRAKPLEVEEIRSKRIQHLIEEMRETMREAPGVGLAAPQIGESLQLAVIEDQPDYQRNVSAERLALLDRRPVPFHVLINPKLTLRDDGPARFFEGCLSVSGVMGVVPRSRSVHVEALNERGVPVSIDARGWYARILQHEIDHLNGTLYIDRMRPRTLTTARNLREHWADVPIADLVARLGA